MNTEIHVKLDLMSFIETNILPRYNAFGHSHGLVHVMRVIANSMVLAKMVGYACMLTRLQEVQIPQIFLQVLLTVWVV